MATVFETETCSRCGGGGQYSYCQSYGTTCFKCHGTGKTLTVRGRVAAEFLRALRTKKAGEVQIGEYIHVPGTPGFAAPGWCKVETIYTKLDGGKSLQPDGTWKQYRGHVLEGVDKKGEAYGLHTFADADVVMVAATKAQRLEWVAAAVAYQETLTKAGTVRKRAMA